MGANGAANSALLMLLAEDDTSAPGARGRIALPRPLARGSPQVVDAKLDSLIAHHCRPASSSADDAADGPANGAATSQY